jgi:hypothetical protein
VKPWEETWEVTERNGGHRLHVEGEEEFATVWGPKDDHRARLAAAAPELARVLLAVEWHRVLIQDEDAYVCPSCGNERLDPGDEVKLAVLVEHGMLGHRPGCALDGALRKAGVR